MDQPDNPSAHRDQPDKKHKKKKHHRSRSRSQHKKHKRSRSRSEQKKDKKKKQKSSHDRHHRHRSSSRDVPKRQDQSRPKENSKGKDGGLRTEKDNELKPRSQSTFKEKTDSRKDRDREQRKQRQHKDRDHKRRDDNSRDNKHKSHRQKSRQRSSLKEEKKQTDKHNHQSHQRKDHSERKEKHHRQRSYERDRHRQKSRYDRYDRTDRHESRRRDRERQTFRSRSQQRRPRSPERNDKFASRKRSRSREFQSRNDRRRQERRRQPNRFDSGPPKSDESDMSDDPQKMQKLNRMKAEKQLVTSKADRKLYLGNLPPNITSQQLMDMLNVALKKMQINTDTEGDSIVSAWISPDGVGHYAFVQFRTAQQATNGLALNGASLFGYQLKLGRPKQYIEYNKQLLSKFGTDSSIDTIIKKVQAMGGEIPLEVPEKIVCPPTRVLVLKHIVTVEELAIDEEFQQIHDDVLDMAKRFGDVLKVVIPRPHEVFDLQAVRTRVKGLGYIFLEYRTVEQAIFARKQLVQKQFSGRAVACSFFNEQRFRQAEYDIVEKVVIDF